MKRSIPSVEKLPARIRVSAAIEKLADRERQVLSLLLLERLTPLEAAGALRMTVRQVEASFALAVETLGEESAVRRVWNPLRRASC
jgi:DNA-directed RNA polymerase specialized sigma24 family protein